MHIESSIVNKLDKFESRLEKNSNSRATLGATLVLIGLISQDIISSVSLLGVGGLQILSALDTIRKKSLNNIRNSSKS